MKLIIKIWLIICAIGTIIIFIWFNSIRLSPEKEIKRAVDAYRVEEYSGIIINKFIDKDEHNFKKVIINENNQERVILFDIELGGLFDFLSIGDSIIKTKGNLQVNVIRNNIDTLIVMKFVSTPARSDL